MYTTESIFASPVKLIMLLLLLHLVADYLLQGCLANLKQASFWQKMFDGHDWASFSAMFRKYGKDYWAGIVCHAALWTLVTFAPLLFATTCSDLVAIAVFIPNAVFHGWVDNLKANHPMRLNLIQDQLLHFAQVVVTAASWLMFVA